MAKGDEITTKFKVDISDLKKGITDANNQIKLANSEFKKASAGMDSWAKSSDGIKAKLSQLKSVLEAQTSKLQAYQKQLETAQKYHKEAATNVENLRKALDKAKSTYGENSAEVKKLQTQLSAAEKTEAAMKKQVSDLTVTMNNQEATVKATEKEMSNLSTSLKDVEKAEKAAAKNGTSVDEELKKMEKQADKTDSKMGKLAKTLAKTLAAGAVAAAAGVVALGKAAITSYADYEQLVGGVDTLFKNSSKKVQEYAANAFKNQGMSANEYMETVTSFSASLLQSLGGDTAKAADVADMALTDMADNANKMGTAMSSIQDAYQGFAKQNYTMLDNLKLGYGGTKTEMERLLKDAQKISGVKYDINNLNDVYEAIHVIQGELGITGTTAQEAATTIQGSTAAMKGAWTNLLVGFADGTQDMDQLVSDFINSVGTVATNVLPRIGEVMSSIGGIIKEHLPEISEQIKTWVSGLLDSIISNLPSGFQELATVIKDVLGTAFEVIENFFGWIVDHGDLVISLLAGITAGFVAFKLAVAISSIIDACTKALEGMTVAQAILNGVMAVNPFVWVALAIGALIAAITLLVLNWDKVKEATVAAWDKIKEAWSQVGEWFTSNVIEPIKNAFSNVDTYMSEHFSNAWTAIKAIWDNVTGYFQAIWDTIKGVFGVVKDVFTGDWQGAWDGIKGIVETWTDYFSSVWENIKTVFDSALNIIKNAWGAVGDWFNTNVIEPIKNFFTGVGTAISDKFSEAWTAVTNVWNAVAQWFSDNVVEPIKTFFQPLTDWFTKLWDSISATISSVFEVIKVLAQGCIESIKLIWGIVSEWFNTNVVQPLTEFFTAMWELIKTKASEVWDGIVAVWTKVKEWFNKYVITPVTNMFTKMWDAIKNAASKVWEGIKNVWNKASNWFNTTVIQPLTSAFDKAWTALKNGASKAWEGIKSVFSKVADFFQNTFEKAWTAVKNVFSTGGKIFDGIKEGIVSAFKTIVNGIINGINKVVKVPFDGINNALNKIRNISIAGVTPFSGLPTISVPQIPQLAKGGILKKGQMGLLEGNGAEAVVPLDRNKYWIRAVAKELKDQLASNVQGATGALNQLTNKSNVNNFTQIINAPKTPSRIELYRQTRNLLELKGGI